MISTNSNWRNNPFLLRPAGKDYLWGGERLKEDFSKETELTPLAETWECSTHPDGLSVVAGGEFRGRTLADVLKEFPQFLGERHERSGELPILIKLIDAKKDLSVQVHPGDEYAREHENGQMGKTEMWYVLDAEKDAKLVYGWQHVVEKADLRQSIEDGTVEKYLQKVPVHKNEVFFIEPGVIHALGAGALVAEIQESSNLTYRLYDYDRTDKNGKKRELHVEKALDVCRLDAMSEPRQPMRVMRYTKGCATELLCRCSYFQVERMIVNTENCREGAAYQTDRLSFRVLLCVEGCGTITCGGGDIRFIKGDCIFVPANSWVIRIHGNAQLLNVIC